MFDGTCTQLKACSVSVAVPGVFFYVRKSTFGSKEVQRGLGRPKYMSQKNKNVICWWSIGAKNVRRSSYPDPFPATPYLLAAKHARVPSFDCESGYSNNVFVGWLLS